MIKGIFYLFSLLISIWALDSININGIFKKNRYYQSRILYFLIAIFLSYTSFMTSLLIQKYYKSQKCDFF